MINKKLTKGAIGFFKPQLLSELTVSVALSLRTVMHKFPEYEMRPPPWHDNENVKIAVSIGSQCLFLKVFG